ncbi:MAG TPA: hypothetical protein VGW38_29815 [Chloroflexota bacterium]|nr:hypothetical protein [Chloroflexota bacterium]
MKHPRAQAIPLLVQGYFNLTQRRLGMVQPPFAHPAQNLGTRDFPR